MGKTLSKATAPNTPADHVQDHNQRALIAGIDAYVADNLDLAAVKAAFSTDIKAACLFVVRRVIVGDTEAISAITSLAMTSKLIKSGLADKFALLVAWRGNGLLDSLPLYFETTDALGVEKGCKSIWKVVEAAYIVSRAPTASSMVLVASIEDAG